MKKKAKKLSKLIKRWDNFLVNIEERFNESLKLAEETVINEMIVSDFDVMPTMTAWGGMKSQIEMLLDKIEETWDNKVEEAFEDLDMDYDHHDEYNKAMDIENRLTEKLNREEKIIEGKVAYTFYNHAQKLFNKQFNCSQCGSELPLNKNIFRSQYVACTACNTVNTFEPETKIGEIEAFAIHKIVDYNTLNEWDIMAQAWDELKAYRGSPPKIYWNNLEQAIVNYWTANLRERIKYQPEYEESFENDLKYKTRYFYKYKEKHQK